MNSSAQRVFLWFVCSCISFIAQAQSDVENRGSSIHILPGQNLYIKGDYINRPKAAGGSFTPQITNSGNLYISGNIINGSGTELFPNNSGTVILDGSSDQGVIGNSPISFFNLTMSKPSGTILIQRNIAVSNNLTLTSGSINLGNNIIGLGSTGLIRSETNENRILSSGTGFISYIIPSNPEINTNLGGTGLHLQGDISAGVPINRLHVITPDASDGSIQRLYKVNLLAGDFISNIRFRYHPAELNGLDETELAIYASSDMGSSWVKIGGTVNAASNFVDLNGQNLGGTVWLTLAPVNCASPPVVDLGPASREFCSGETVTLNAGNAGNSYLWSTGATSQTITVSESGSYGVIVTTDRGCEGTDNITLIKREKPTVSFTSSTVCDGNSTNFTNQSTGSGLSYSWNFGDPATSADVSTQENPSYTYPDPGRYNVRLITRNQFGCEDTFTKQVFVAPIPVANFFAENSCLGDAVTFVNQTRMDSTILSFNALTFLWEFGDGSASSLKDPVYQYTNTGTYTVRLTVTSNIGCTDQIEKQIQVLESPVASFEAASACSGEPLSFTNNSTISSGNLSYLWNFGDGTSSTDRIPTKLYAEAGSYNIMLEVSSDSGCKNSVTQRIIIQPCELGDCINPANQPMVDLGPDRDLCPGLEIVLDAGNPNASYIWSDGSTQKELEVNEGGVYSVQVTNVLGCIVIDEVEITELKIDLPDTIKLCLNEEVTFELPDFNNVTYSWKVNDNPISSNSSLTTNNAGKYKVEVVGSGCTLRDSVVLLEDPDPITARFLASTVANVGDSIQFVNLSTPEPSSTLWNFGDGATSSDLDPIHAYQIEGDFNAQLEVEDGRCSSSKAKIITVRFLREGAQEGSVVFTRLINTSVYPNPTKGQLYLDIHLNKETSVTIGIYDNQGRLLESKEATFEETIMEFNVSEFGPGSYFIKVRFNNEQTVLRFVVL